jgi:SAM-dependent methyltransferase
MDLLNIGCGSIFHPAWINIDAVTSSAAVLEQDISKGLQFTEKSFDVCYASHVLEHLTVIEAQNLMLECWRVLRSQGVLRLAVPDLETITKTYLHALREVELGSSAAESNYDWIMLELYDQVARNCAGGEMSVFLSQPHIKNRDFIVSRIGFEAERYWDSRYRCRLHCYKN